MKKLLPGALALVLSVSLAACSKSAEPQPSARSAPVSSSSATQTPALSSGNTDDSGTNPSAGSGTSTSPGTSTAAGPGDQTTPEAAMTSWLGAMVAGNGRAVCELMASGGKTISSIPGAASACGTSISPMLAQIKQLGAAFTGLKISGATVTGDKASFESVTTEPALAADVVSSFKAVRINGKWYVTQG